MNSIAEAFVRQRSVPDWNIDTIQNQSALLLGVGGIGCTIALALCRLGIKKLHLLDMDVVDATNLNRQVLYSASDVGRKKVEAARAGLAAHNLQTTLVAHDVDAIAEWDRVVELAKESTVVFNGIDHGGYFDYAVTSLCIRLRCHYVTASSYGHTAIAENFPVPKRVGTGPCWACNNSPTNQEILDKLAPQKIASYSNLSFVPKDTHMPGSQSYGSSVLVASLAAHQAVTAWANSLSEFDTIPHWVTFNLRTFEMFSYKVEQNSRCRLCVTSEEKEDPTRSSTALDARTLSIYFGRHGKVSLREVGGSVREYASGCLKEEPSEELCKAAHSRLSPLAELGTEYEDVYVPATPSTDLVESGFNEVKGGLGGMLSKPLLKAAEGPFKAIPSGVRSAILINNSEGICYRLKGCGCYTDSGEFRVPFPSQPIESKTSGIEIKGCCFKHTAERELFMTEKVGRLLAPHGLKAGNDPLGAFAYSLGDDEPFPKIPKYCCVYKTIGEKRLASDLLAGLERLLPSLIPNLELDQILSLFPERRLQGKSVQATWRACCTSNNLSPIDMCCHPLDESAPDTRARGSDALELCNDLKKVLPLVEELKLKYGSCLALLYWRLGREAGFFKRLLEDNSISWGYFIDHNPFEPHCNSHPNNFVLVPEALEGEGGQLLAPVDFDLAFSKSTFFSPYTGNPDADLFDSWIASEHAEMERALGGEQANSGVQMNEAELLPPSHAALKWGLRDTLLAGYRSAYAKLPDCHPIPDCLHTPVRRLVDLVLLLGNEH